MFTRQLWRPNKTRTAMRLASDIEDFWRDPIGRYFVERAFLQFCAAADLWGYMIWGDIGESDLQALARTVGHKGWNDFQPHRSFIDFSRVTSIDTSGYAILRAAQAANRDELARRITQMVIVRPDGIVGAIAEGIQHLVSFPHPVEVVASAEEALRRLGVEDAGVLPVLEAARASLESSARVVADLHAVLDAHLPEFALPAVAKLLGMSPRSLQRKLRELGTSYQAERNLAQVRVAQRLMSQTDATLSQIALDVGCRSLQHFSTLFRRIAGETPSQWRVANRR
jgi:AraC-like DNA-binding protein